MSDQGNGSVDRQMRRVGALIESLEKLTNPAARVVAQELVQTLLALHEAALAKMLKLLARTEDGATVAAAWGRDDLVGSLLLLHGLHPVDVETRARKALDQVRPLLRCHGGDVELVAVTKGIARVRMLGSCALSAEELEHTIEEAFLSIAPDVQVIEVENDHTGPTQRIALPLVS